MGNNMSRRQFLGTAAMTGAALTGMGNALAAAQAPKGAADWDEKNGPAPAAPDAPQALPLGRAQSPSSTATFTSSTKLVPSSAATREGCSTGR